MDRYGHERSGGVKRSNELSFLELLLEEKKYITLCGSYVICEKSFKQKSLSSPFLLVFLILTPYCKAMKTAVKRGKVHEKTTRSALYIYMWPKVQPVVDAVRQKDAAEQCRLPPEMADLGVRRNEVLAFHCFLLLTRTVVRNGHQAGERLARPCTAASALRVAASPPVAPSVPLHQRARTATQPPADTGGGRVPVRAMLCTVEGTPQTRQRSALLMPEEVARVGFLPR